MFTNEIQAIFPPCFVVNVLQVTISGPEKNVNSAKTELIAEDFGQIN